jgi:hypothetical protein
MPDGSFDGHLVEARARGGFHKAVRRRCPWRLGPLDHGGTGPGDPHGVLACYSVLVGRPAETVWNWRKVFGVTKWGMEGSRRLHQGLSEKAGAKLRGKKLPRALVERRLAVCLEMGPCATPPVGATRGGSSTCWKRRRTPSGRPGSDGRLQR